MTIEYGDELVTVVQIDQPLCTREYGDGFLVSPHVGCQAILGDTGTRKCFNSRATCQDPDNYDPGTLTLTFSHPQEGLAYLGYVIPSLEDVSTTPLKINIGAMDRNLSPFGQREVVALKFADHQHSDLLVDKYRLERHTGAADQDGTAYDPHERGTFWGKWLARNPYYEGYALRVYQGKVGQALAGMEVRHYLIDKINGPADGTVSIVAKDIFTKAEDRKAKAPNASRGELASGISAAAGSATLSPTGIGDLDYPASGRVAIGDEIIAFTRSGDTLTLSTRGALNTVAEAHDAEDKVQLVLSYAAQEAQDIVHDLLTQYAGIDAGLIPKADWDTEADANFANLYTAHIAEPTAVSKLVGELAEQAGFSLWPDVRNNQIRLKAIVPANSGSIDVTVDDDAWIVEKSLAILRMPDQRASQLWVYYGQIDPLEDLDDKKNYRSRVIVADLNAEDDTQYGTASVREVFSRWIPQFGRSSATDVGERLLAIFRDPPFRARFQLYAAREGMLDLADPFRLNTDEIVDDTGANKITTHLPIKVSREEDIVSVESQQLQFFVEPDADSPSAASERQIFIENDTNDFDCRAEHDTLFAAPSSGTVVRVFVESGVVVGSTSISTPALKTGSWPSGVELIIENRGRITGKGGLAGLGGGDGSAHARNGDAGQSGGLALQVTFATKINNISGVIAGGGGGGGGGGCSSTADEFGDTLLPAGGGGGGAGRQGGSGVGSTNVFGFNLRGSDGTATAGGSGGTGTSSGGNDFAGDGGTGGGPGQSGSAGETGTTVTGSFVGTGGAGGSAGAAISGVSNITWIDDNDDPTADDGTVLGSTS